jgi:hypothetical protein
MDEHSNHIGTSLNGKVLAEAGTAYKGSVFIQENSNREWIIVIKSILALYRCISPLIIFKGQNLQSTWFPVNIKDLSSTAGWHFACSQNG